MGKPRVRAGESLGHAAKKKAPSNAHRTLGARRPRYIFHQSALVPEQRALSVVEASDVGVPDVNIPRGCAGERQAAEAQL
jgi:hypothetical protein